MGNNSRKCVLLFMAMSVFNSLSADHWQDWLKAVRDESWVDCKGNYITWHNFCKICRDNSLRFIKDYKNANWFCSGNHMYTSAFNICCYEYVDIPTLFFYSLKNLFCQVPKFLGFTYILNPDISKIINISDWMCNNVGNLYNSQEELKHRLTDMLCYIFECSSVYEVWCKVYGDVYLPWLKVFEKLSTPECGVVTKENVDLFENAYKMAIEVGTPFTNICNAIETKIRTVRESGPMET
ncbi:MAG: hypothetical protein LBB20_02430, partial [Puniceicoccales bacterium]|nr:hypothetical protein [Puniceicoccales bacterium]